MISSHEVLCAFIIFLLNNFARSTEISVILLCDQAVYDVCSDVTRDSKLKFSADDFSVNFTGTALHSFGNFVDDARTLQQIDTEDTVVYLGFGDDHVVNAVTSMARGLNIPVIVYSTSRHRAYIYQDNVLPIHPDHQGLAQAIITLIGKPMMEHVYVICQDSLVSDGFLQAFFREDIINIGYNKTNQVLVSKQDSDLDLQIKLLDIHDSGFRLIVVHSSPEIFERIAKVAETLAYLDVGYAWIITEEAFVDIHVEEDDVSMTTENFIPRGILAVIGDENDVYKEIIGNAILAVRQEVTSLLKHAADYGLSKKYLAENFRKILAGRSDLHSLFSRGLVSNKLLFDGLGRRRGMKFRLLNYVENHHNNISAWKTVGYISENELDLQTVVWPGHSIFGPINKAREFFTIVTRRAEPFMYIRGPVDERSQCAANTQCLELFTFDPIKVKQIVENFKHGQMSYGTMIYKIHCCEGIVVDILNALAVEMRFDFLLYFQEDQNYGKFRNGTWSGMVGDVISGAADMMAGAVSITSERLNAITFTEAFYFSSFTMISGNNDRHTTLMAFLNPFHPYVWLMIIITATCVAFALSLLEWNSPFGLNPWGKCRKQNYTLGSALTAVFSLWFGNTVKAKSPKSWPSKFLQNCWACMSIFMLAAYTANLAAFMAGEAFDKTIYSVLDSQLSTKRVGIVQTSAAEEHIKNINPSLQTQLQSYYVSGTEEAFPKLRNRQLDLYIDDTPLLEYSLSRFDQNCSIRYASHSFGETSYAFGMIKDSWLKKRLDSRILNYVEEGYVEDLKWRYMGRDRKCGDKFVNTKTADLMFGLTHTGGLFVFLLGAIGVSLILLIMEHITYFLILPRLKKRPLDSIWKKRNLEFFSQRLYKSINSEKVEPPAKVLLSKVKQRKFELQTKLRRQIKSVPVNLSAYHLRNRPLDNILNIYKHFNETRNSQSDGAIHTISDGADDFNIEDWVDIATATGSRYPHNRRGSISDSSSGYETYFDNPVFEADDYDIILENTNQSQQNTRNRLQSYRSNSQSKYEENTANKRSLCYKSFQNLKMNLTPHIRFLNRFEKASETDTVNDRNLTNQKRLSRRYETWPSPQTRKRSFKKLQNNTTNSFSDSDVKHQNLASNEKIVNEISKICRTCSTSSLNGINRKSSGRININVKDNRLKSSIRNHAMASINRRRTSVFDMSAVEALSKEDLLVLWKRSEIEFQTRLNRMLHQNQHLQHLVDIVETYQRERNVSAVEQLGENSLDTERGADEDHVLFSTWL